MTVSDKSRQSAKSGMLPAKWPTGTIARLTFDLLFWTGQRISDVSKMRQSDIAGSSLHIKQKKTGTELILPIVEELATSISSTQTHGERFLPYKSSSSLSNAFRRWKRAAGLPERCTSHGLRKARATALANAGKTPHQIAAVTGHKTLAEVERYTRQVDQKRLAEEAFREQTVSVSKPKIKTGTIKSKKY